MPKNSVGESFTVALNSCSEKVYGQQGGGEYQDFLPKNFCLTVPKIFVEEFFTVAAISGTGNIDIRRGVSGFSVEIFFSHSAEIFRRGFFYCCINFGYRKSLDNKGGVSRISVENFCLTVPKVYVRESFTNALISGSEKVWIGGEGEQQDFPPNVFCLILPKICVGESNTVAVVSGSEKLKDNRGEGSIVFPSKIFCLTVPKVAVRESFIVALNSGTEKVWRRGGEYQHFPSKIFCLRLPKNSVGESITVALVSGREKVYRRQGEGVSRLSFENFLSHSAEIFRSGILYCCIKFGSEKVSRRGGSTNIFRRKFFLSVCRKFP